MPIVLRLFGPTTPIKVIKGQSKDGKDQKIVSQLSRFIDLC